MLIADPSRPAHGTRRALQASFSQIAGIFRMPWQPAPQQAPPPSVGDRPTVPQEHSADLSPLRRANTNPVRSHVSAPGAQNAPPNAPPIVRSRSDETGANNIRYPRSSEVPRYSVDYSKMITNSKGKKGSVAAADFSADDYFRQSREDQPRLSVSIPNVGYAPAIQFPKAPKQQPACCPEPGYSQQRKDATERGSEARAGYIIVNGTNLSESQAFALEALVLTLQQTVAAQRERLSEAISDFEESRNASLRATFEREALAQTVATQKQTIDVLRQQLAGATKLSKRMENIADVAMGNRDMLRQINGADDTIPKQPEESAEALRNEISTLQQEVYLTKKLYNDTVKDFTERESEYLQEYTALKEELQSLRAKSDEQALSVANQAADKTTGLQDLVIEDLKNQIFVLEARVASLSAEKKPQPKKLDSAITIQSSAYTCPSVKRDLELVKADVARISSTFALSQFSNIEKSLDEILDRFTLSTSGIGKDIGELKQSLELCLKEPLTAWESKGDAFGSLEKNVVVMWTQGLIDALNEIQQKI
ncbi:hypothetical protein HDU82_000156 [Entophlyctis luteolus]|nr:hypothetical protein HDU82_000156 [Entophlyctis luteolus]